MSRHWVQDISDMHHHFGVKSVVNNMDSETLMRFMEFRVKQLQEELDEFKTALAEKDAENAVDALIDLAVFTIGTLDLAQVDSYKAWDNVLNANMSKNVGIKEGRPNPWGLPDLMKPEGWTPPSHEGNHGKFGVLFDN